MQISVYDELGDLLTTVEREKGQTSKDLQIMADLMADASSIKGAAFYSFDADAREFMIMALGGLNGYAKGTTDYLIKTQDENIFENLLHHFLAVQTLNWFLKDANKGGNE